MPQCMVTEKDAESTSELGVPLSDFTIFAKLPAELRLMIWTLAIPQGQILKVGPKNAQHDFLIPSQIYEHPLVTAYVVAGMLYANGESRFVATKEYEIAFDTHSNVSPMFLNYKRDIVLIGACLLTSVLTHNSVNATITTNRIVHLMLDGNCSLTTADLENLLPKHYSSVRSLTFTNMFKLHNKRWTFRETRIKARFENDRMVAGEMRRAINTTFLSRRDMRIQALRMHTERLLDCCHSGEKDQGNGSYHAEVRFSDQGSLACAVQ